MTVNQLLQPARRPSESKSDYRARRQAANAYVERRLRGRVLWYSRNGTYRISEHGALA